MPSEAATVSIFCSENKYLVFSSVGDTNCIHHWLADSSHRNFDLITYYYGDDPDFSPDSNLLISRKGLKYENFYHCVHNINLSNYEAVWVVDDDIVMQTHAINRMFARFSQFNLLLAQPSFCADSRVSWQITRQDPTCTIRYTNFVENGVAIFSRDVLEVLKPTFKVARTGWGIDLIWPKLMGFPARKIAVIDDVCCVHPSDAPSSLNRVIPRHLHRYSGIELLKRYDIVPKDLPPSANWNEVSQNLAYEVRVLGRIESKR
jgi:hypothetical protein